MLTRFFPLVFLLLWTGPAIAQSDTESCPAESLSLSDASAASATGEDARRVATSRVVQEPTEAEEQVQDIIAEDGVHVIHFWAPWCPNSTGELSNGWYEVVEQHENVSFTFVTVWNDGESGRETLDQYAIPDRVVELTQPDHGPSDREEERRRSFLGLPVTWIPTTWIFHNNGELAFAMNYGEMDMETLSHLIDLTHQDW